MFRACYRHRDRLQLWGWGLFVLCALGFTAVGLRDRDWLVLASSLLFLAACVFFILPLLGRQETEEEDPGTASQGGTPAACGSQIRNSKFEIRNKFEIPKGQ